VSERRVAGEARGGRRASWVLPRAVLRSVAGGEPDSSRLPGHSAGKTAGVCRQAGVRRLGESLRAGAGQRGACRQAARVGELPARRLLARSWSSASWQPLCANRCADGLRPSCVGGAKSNPCGGLRCLARKEEEGSSNLTEGEAGIRLDFRHVHVSLLTSSANVCKLRKLFLSRGVGNYFASRSLLPEGLWKIAPTRGGGGGAMFCLAGRCRAGLQSSLEKLIYGIRFSKCEVLSL